MPEQVNTLHFEPLGPIKSVVRSPLGAEIRLEDALLRIDVLGETVMRMSISRTGRFDEQPTYAVLQSSLPTHPFAFELNEDEDAVKVSTAGMTIVATREPFKIDAYRADGSVIFESADVKGKFDGPESVGKSGAYLSLNDEFVVARKCRPDDAMLGLGEKTGQMNRMGRSFTLWNTDVLSPDASGAFIRGRDRDDPRSDSTSTEFDPYYVSIPFFVHLRHPSSQASGFFIDNGYQGHFEFQHEDHYRFHFTGQYTEYVFAGPSMAEIIGEYTRLTGRMEPPPIWALGYHQCRWHAYTQASMERLAGHFRENDIPCDALWLDIEYMNGYRVFTWNDKTFPDPGAMIEKFKEQGIRAISIIDPGVKAEPGYEVFDQGMARDIFCRTQEGNIYTGQVWPGKTAFPDFSTAEGRRWWGERNAAHVSSGLAGIWNDMNEPATGEIAPEAMRFNHGTESHERYHNQYAMLMAMATRDGLLAEMPTLRTFILSRAGSPGIQRYAANWMGDNMSRWDHLWMSMPMAMGLGLSGQPFVGADIGGFAESTNPELLARWMQYGVLTPFCRNHSNRGNIDQYPWSFGPALMNIIRDAIKLRYQLMPALYTAFIQSSEDGLPIQRPLVLNYQDDRTARDIDDEYLLGSNLLVAPVYHAGAHARVVYLPTGTWHNWHTGAATVGPRFVTAEAPMEYIPFFAKGGAIIPMWPDAPQSTMNYHPGVIDLHLFLPSEDETQEFVSDLHEDDGLTRNMADGAYLRTKFQVQRSGAQLTIAASTSGNGYPEFTRAQFRLIVHGGSITGAQLDGQAITPGSDGAFAFANSGGGFRLEGQIGA